MQSPPTLKRSTRRLEVGGLALGDPGGDLPNGSADHPLATIPILMTQARGIPNPLCVLEYAPPSQRPLRTVLMAESGSAVEPTALLVMGAPLLGR